MALVEKSPLDVSLNVKTKGCGQWNYMDLEREYPELIRRGCQPLAVKDGRQLLRAAEDEGPAAVEEADHEAPGIPERNRNPSTLPLMPSSGLSKIKAKATHVESQPLIDGNAQDGDVPLYFSRGGLWSEEQQVRVFSIFVIWQCYLTLAKERCLPFITYITCGSCIEECIAFIVQYLMF